MTDLKRLASMLMELDDQMAACMKCGMCQAVCPVFSETMLEADVTRGKITLLEHLGREMIKDPAQVSSKLNRCLLCGSCEANCPSGVKIMDIFMKARVIITSYKGLSPGKKLVFRGLLKHPRLFNLLTEMSAKFQGAVTHIEDQSAHTASCGILSPLIGKRHLTLLNKRPFRKDYPFLDTERGSSGLKAAFFTGCLADKLYPNIGHAAIKVLKHHGTGIFIPDGQGCCGIPALASGDIDTFKDLIRMNIDAFEKKDFDYLITPCATCTSVIKKTWLKMLKNDDKALYEKVRSIASITMDISEFLVDKVGIEIKEKPGIKKTVTYHDPCHLDKSLGITAQPRKLISASSAELKEMNEANRCCGCGGTFNLYHYDISKKIGERKEKNIRFSGADIAATSCPACMMQINDLLSQSGGGIRVCHVIELYADSIED
ncbi:MAG: (Fe-S)-binding protein [Desulfobacteraceae bacterium]